MLEAAEDVSFLRRRNRFFGEASTGSGDPILNDLADIAPARVDASDPLEQAATGLVRSSLESHALSMQMPLVGADMDRMLSAAQYLLRGMPRSQLAGLSPSSSIMQSLTSASFSIAMAPDMQQRVMRMTHEKAALASQAAAVEEQARTGGVVALGYQRGIRARDDGERSSLSRSSLGGLGVDGLDASSARFAGLGITPAVARVMQQASHEAVRSGIPWAATKPDLLKQGAAGVKAVADVQIKEPTYQRLTTQAHFVAKEVVTLSTFAKAKGITDANPLAHATADVVQIGKTVPEQINTKNAITNYMAASSAAAANPDDPAARARLEAAGMLQKTTLTPIAASSPENYTKVQTYEDKAKVEQRFRATTMSKEYQAELKAEQDKKTAVTTAVVQTQAEAAKATAAQQQVSTASVQAQADAAKATAAQQQIVATAEQAKAASVQANLVQLQTATAVTVAAASKTADTAELAFGIAPPTPNTPAVTHSTIKAEATLPQPPASTAQPPQTAPAPSSQQVEAKPGGSPPSQTPTQTAQVAPAPSAVPVTVLAKPDATAPTAPTPTAPPTQTAEATPAKVEAAAPAAPTGNSPPPTQTAATAPAKPAPAKASSAPAMKPA